MDFIGLIGGITGLISIIIVIWRAGFSLGSLFKDVDKLKENDRELNERITRAESVCDRVTILETKIELFWKLVEQNVSGLLKSPHTPRFDVLLDKFANRMLTLDEALELKDELAKDSVKSPGDSTRAIIRALVMARLEQVILELRGNHGV